MRFSLPLIPTTLCWLITDLSDRYLVTYFCGAEVNGIYSAAYKIPTVVTLLSSIFMQAWQFSAVAEASDEEECSRFYTNVFSGFISFVMIGATGLLLFSGLLTRLLLSTSFHGAVLYMPTLLISAALEALVSFLATVYLVRKKSMHSFLTAMAGAVLNILLNVWWIPLFDRLGYAALGAAIATLTSYAAVLVIRLIDAPRWITFRRYTLRVTGSALILLGLGAVVTFSLPYSILWMTLLTVGMLALNGYPLWKSAAALLKKRGNG